MLIHTVSCDSDIVNIYKLPNNKYRFNQINKYGKISSIVCPEFLIKNSIANLFEFPVSYLRSTLLGRCYNTSHKSISIWHFLDEDHSIIFIEKQFNIKIKSSIWMLEKDFYTIIN